MTMDNAEIVIDYRRAKQKNRQIGVLAELNQCSREKIVQILTEAGEELPKYKKPGRKPGYSPKKAATEPKDDKPAEPPAPADDPNPIPEKKPEEPKDKLSDFLKAHQGEGVPLRPMEFPVSRDEYRTLYEQVASLTETMKTVATKLCALEQRTAPSGDAWNTQEIRGVAFDVLITAAERSLKAEVEHPEAIMLTAAIAIGDLINRLENGGKDPEEPEETTA